MKIFFCIVLLCSYHLFLISSASVRKFFVEIKEITALFISKFKQCRKSQSVFFKGEGWITGRLAHRGGVSENQGSVRNASCFSSFLHPMSPCPVIQLCLTLCDPMDGSPPGSSVHRILQARILEWVTISSCRGSSQPRDWTLISWVSWIAGEFFTAEPPGKPLEKGLKRERGCVWS